VEILLTTVVAYLSFLVADRVFHVSGIMATVGAGLMMGGWGRTKFSASNLEHSERFWAYLGFIASSLVFLMVGFYINQMWTFDKIGQVGIAVAISMIARAVSIYGLMPLVNRMPGIEDADLRHQTVMVWGGFRGAMTLVLAMSLPDTFAYRSDFIILAVGVVLFSLLFQGLTLEPIIKMLGLHRATLPEQYVREGSMLTAKHRARERIEELRKRGIFNPLAVGELEERYVAEEAEIRRNIDGLRKAGLMGSRDELRYLKREYLLVEKRTYLELFHRGQLSERMLKDLQHSIELQLDYLRSGGVLPPWTLHSPLRWKLETIFLSILDTVVPGAMVTQRYRLNRIADRYEEHWGRLVSTEKVLAEVQRMQETGGASPDLLEEMRETYVRWNENARKRIDAIAEQFPEYATKVQQLMAARLCLQAEEEVIQELERLEILPDREARALREQVNKKLKRLRHKPLEELRARPEELLAKVPFFRGLPRVEFDRVVPLLRSRTVLADEIILKEGDAGNSLYLIGRGVVRVLIGSSGVPAIPIATLLAGDFFGEMAVLTGNPRTATVTAVTHCMLYELRREDLEAVAIVCPSIQVVLEAAHQKRGDELDAVRT
jgi:CPA1 family monovalent cation:H+ antiporter